ncbi:MAG: hypothetical protein ACR2RF_12915 [Geminicoccaceae bacterium]
MIPTVPVIGWFAAKSSSSLDIPDAGPNAETSRRQDGKDRRLSGRRKGEAAVGMTFATLFN